MSEELARLFHDTYERLAPEYGYETREETREFDPDSPNGRLMRHVCAEVMESQLAEREAEIKRLRELVNRMFVHCTTENGEMTRAELDEWLEQAQEGEKDDPVWMDDEEPDLGFDNQGGDLW